MECYHWLLHLVTMVTTITAVLGCPKDCSCDEEIVFCQQLNTTWSQLLEQLPKNVKHLAIESSTFLMETPVEMKKNEVESNTAKISKIFHDLTKLEIQDSSLVHLASEAFAAMPNVKQLRFNVVRFGNMTLSMLSSLKQLESVDLSRNHLEEIPEGILEAWSEIRYLNLQHNEIREFSFVVFQKAPNLETLDLSHNNISFVHPLVESTENWTSPSSVNLHSNQLSYIHPSVVHNLTHPTDLHLGNNPWDCHCGMQWLSDILSNTDQSNVVFIDASQMQCETPTHLRSTKVMTLATDSLECQKPVLQEMPPNLTLLFMTEGSLECNVSGYPPPSVYWLTPHGPIVHPDNRYWVPVDVAMAPDHLAFNGPPHHLHASVRAQLDNSIVFKNFRYFFEGEYTCVAVNPAGMVSHSINVTIAVNIQESVQWSMLWGFASAVGFLLFGISCGSIRLCAERFCCPPPHMVEDDKVDEEIPDDYSEYSEESFYMYDRSPCWSNRGSPRRSPMKCVTPAEGFIGDHHYIDRTGNIRETLETVRARLRLNMERHVGKIRTRAQNMKKNSHRYMQNVRHTTGHYMKNIKHTSSQYVHKVRDGMVLGVEQVKYTVQSMKEMCGTGDLAHTISTVSISTDVDSQRQTAVVKTVTFV